MKKIDRKLWNSSMTANELAELFGCRPMTIHQYARINGLKYVRVYGMKKRIENSWELKTETDQEKAVKELVKRWRNGDDNAGRELLSYGIKASRCMANDKDAAKLND